MKNKCAPHSILICLFVALAFALPSSAARANNPYWTSLGADADWFDADNWTDGVPTCSSYASINDGGKAELSDPGAVAFILILAQGETESGTLVVRGPGVLSAAECEAPYNPGAIFVGLGGAGTMAIIEGGRVESGEGYIALLAGHANGEVTVDGEDSLWSLEGRLFIGVQFSGDPGGTAVLNLTNDGAVTVNNPENDLPAIDGGSSGTITGDGTITITGPAPTPGPISRRMDVNGTLAPTGELDIVGNLRLLDDDGGEATTLFYVTPQAQDKVNVSGTGAGTATLAGDLIVTLSGTFSPGLDCTATFILLHADGGRVSNSEFGDELILGIPQPNPPYTAAITYDTNNVYLVLTFNNCEPE